MLMTFLGLLPADKLERLMLVVRAGAMFEDGAVGFPALTFNTDVGIAARAGR